VPSPPVYVCSVPDIITFFAGSVGTEIDAAPEYVVILSPDVSTPITISLSSAYATSPLLSSFTASASAKADAFTSAPTVHSVPAVYV